MVFCVDTGKQLWAPYSSAPGSSWEPGSSTQGCANPHGTIPELSLASSSSHRAGTSMENSPCNTDSAEGTRGKAEQRVYLQMGNVSNTAFLSQQQSQGFSTRKQQWKTIQETPALSRLSCLLALLLLLLEGCVVGFPLLSQFVGLGKRDPRDLSQSRTGPATPRSHQSSRCTWRMDPMALGYGEQLEEPWP